MNIETISASKTVHGNIVLTMPEEHAKMLRAMMQNIADSYKEDCYEKSLASTIAKQIGFNIVK